MYEIIGVCVIVVLVSILIKSVESSRNRKSGAYRKEVMDMYVASKTRQLAERDDLDLSKEEDIFKRWLRKVKAKEENYELDDAIEDDLKERISEPITKKK